MKFVSLQTTHLHHSGNERRVAVRWKWQCWDVEQRDAKPREVDKNRCCGHKKEASTSYYMSGIPRVRLLKVIGVTVINGLSASDHVRGVVTKWLQTLYALRVLRTHGMSDSALQIIVRSVILCVQCLVGFHQCDINSMGLVLSSIPAEFYVLPV